MLRGMRNKRAHDARLQADALLQSDKFDKAIGMYTAALNISSDGAEHCAACHNGKATAYGLCGRCAFHSSQRSGSLFEARALARALAIRSRLPFRSLRHQLIVSVCRHNRWDDALAAWQLAAKVDDKNNPAYIHYQGLAHFKLNQFKPAETMFQAALSLGFERSAEQLGLVRRLMAEQNASELYSEPQHDYS